MLSSEHRRLLSVDQGIIAIVINVLLNGGIAWLLFSSVSVVPLWGESSVGIDLILTAFLLPFLSCLIVSRIVAGQVRSGKLPPLPTAQVPESGWSHRSIRARGALLGVCSVFLAAGPIVVALSLADSATFGASAFIGFKAGWGGLLGGVVSPVIAWWALAEASRAPRS
jgi:hypothetical protein